MKRARVSNGCVFGECVFKNYRFLATLAHEDSPAERLALIKEATDAELLTLAECCLNVLDVHHTPLDQDQLKELKPYAKEIRALSQTECTDDARHCSQVGYGAFLPALLLPLLGEVVRFALSNHKKKKRRRVEEEEDEDEEEEVEENRKIKGKDSGFVDDDDDEEQ